MRGQLCALPLDCVAEIMRPLPVTSLAGTPSFVSGMSVIRGHAIPVVDAGALLGSGEAPAPARFVTLKVDGRQVALAVEQVVGIRGLAAESLHGLPQLLSEVGSELVESIGMLDREFLLVLRTARIVPDSVWASLQDAGAP